MPRPKQKKLDPKVLWIVTESTPPITPTFYHEDLGTKFKEVGNE